MFFAPKFPYVLFVSFQVVEQLPPEKDVYTTCGQNVLCTHVHRDVSALAPCSHEEADTRIILHMVDTINNGYHRIMIRTVDTDVLVLAVSNAVLHSETEIWIAFGTGKHLRYIPAHQIAASLGNERARALPMFHSFTGCDTVSAFAGRSKKTAFDVWKSFGDLTPVLCSLSSDPSSFQAEHMSVMESFVVLMYDRTCQETEVNAARKHMFCTKSRSIDAIPPTAAALLQHTKRAIYQGGFVWGQAQECAPVLPSPDAWGWKKSTGNQWEPVWTLLPQAVESCSELLRCGCKKGCRGHCKCVKAALRCTSLCHCGGSCEHNHSV